MAAKQESCLLRGERNAHLCPPRIPTEGNTPPRRGPRHLPAGQDAATAAPFPPTKHASPHPVSQGRDGTGRERRERGVGGRSPAQRRPCETTKRQQRSHHAPAAAGTKRCGALGGAGRPLEVPGSEPRSGPGAPGAAAMRAPPESRRAERPGSAALPAVPGARLRAGGAAPRPALLSPLQVTPRAARRGRLRSIANIP